MALHKKVIDLLGVELLEEFGCSTTIIVYMSTYTSCVFTNKYTKNNES